MLPTYDTIKEKKIQHIKKQNKGRLGIYIHIFTKNTFTYFYKNKQT